MPEAEKYLSFILQDTNDPKKKEKKEEDEESQSLSPLLGIDPSDEGTIIAKASFDLEELRKRSTDDNDGDNDDD